MRENRLSGSEGGGVANPPLPTPIQGSLRRSHELRAKPALDCGSASYRLPFAAGPEGSPAPDGWTAVRIEWETSAPIKKPRSPISASATLSVPTIALDKRNKVS